MRWIAYAGFAFELAFIYVVMLQSMLGTAGLFLAAAGIVLGLLAFVIIRVEKRMKAATGSREPQHDDRQQDSSSRRWSLALAQIGFLGWIIAGRAAILRDGQEILLKVEPVDPRDLLRGDYVRLGYEISRIPVKLIANIPAGKLSERRHVDRGQAEEGRRRLLAADRCLVRAGAGAGRIR